MTKYIKREDVYLMCKYCTIYIGDLSMDFDIYGGSWNQSTKVIKGGLYMILGQVAIP